MTPTDQMASTSAGFALGAQDRADDAGCVQVDVDAADESRLCSVLRTAWAGTEVGGLLSLRVQLTGGHFQNVVDNLIMVSAGAVVLSRLGVVDYQPNGLPLSANLTVRKLSTGGGRPSKAREWSAE